MGLVVLWKSINAESAPVTASPHAPRPAAEPAAPAPAPKTTTAPAIRAPAPPVLPSRHAEPAESSTVDTRSMPTLGSDEPPPGTRANTKHLEWGVTQMRALIEANAGKVNECLAQAAANGDRPTGDATLTFIAARRGDKIVIEDTSVDSEGTTLKSDALLDCLHQTSKAMTFEGLPREAAAVFITRSVSVENGTLAANKFVKFSYIR